MKFSKFSGMDVKPLNSEGSIGTVVNAVLDEKSRRFSHYLVDTGHLLQRQYSLIAVENAALAETHVQLNLTEPQLEPILTPDTDEVDPVDLTGMPNAPGPFGQIVSPDLLASIMDALSPVVTNEDDVPMERDHLNWLSDLLGLPVFETTTEYGVFSDVDFDPFSGEVKSIVVQTQTGATYDIEFDNVRNIVPGQDIIIELKPVPEWAKLTS